MSEKLLREADSRGTAPAEGGLQALHARALEIMDLLADAGAWAGRAVCSRHRQRQRAALAGGECVSV